MKKLKLISLISMFSFFLTSCDTDEIKDRITHTVNEMLPNLWITLVQLALFIIVAILFIVFAYKPIKKKLNARSEYIENNIKEAEKKNKEAEENIKKSNQYINESQKKAGEIIQAAQKTAEVKAHNLEMEMSKNIEETKTRVHKELELERKKMIVSANEEIVDSVILTSKEILKREIKKEDNEEFINDFINELNKKGTSSN